MALNATTITSDGVIVVRLNGAILFGEESASLRSLVKGDLLIKSRQIVLDLNDVSAIDSGGLGTLVGLYASARKMGGDIKLARIGRRANEVLQITKLLTLFDVFDKVEEAIASFKGAAAANKTF